MHKGKTERAHVAHWRLEHGILIQVDNRHLLEEETHSMKIWRHEEEVPGGWTTPVYMHLHSFTWCVFMKCQSYGHRHRQDLVQYICTQKPHLQSACGVLGYNSCASNSEEWCFWRVVGDQLPFLVELFINNPHIHLQPAQSCGWINLTHWLTQWSKGWKRST
jgi:hypothetical protein